MATKRRPHGTGSVYYDAARDRWVGSIELGWTARGTRRRRRFVGGSERDVRAKIRKALSEAEALEAPVVGGKPTVKRWADVWLDVRQSSVRPSTWNADRSAVHGWIVPTIGHKRLDALAPPDVRAVTAAVLAAGRAPSTAVRAQVVLEKMLRDAIVEGYQVPQRVLMVTGPDSGENDRDAIPLADALDLLRAAAERPDGSRWVATLLNGMRQGECLGLTWDAVDLDAGTLDVSWQLQPLPYNVPRDRTSGFRVPVGYAARQLDGALHLVRPKSKSGTRIIPLVPWMASALQSWRDVAPPSPHRLVWPRPDGRPQRADLDLAAWHALQDAARVAHVSEDGRGRIVGRRYGTHEGRHTTATLLLEAGVDEHVVTAILGHSSIVTSRGYQHVSHTLKRQALDGIAERLRLHAEVGAGA